MIDYDNKSGTVHGQDWYEVREVLVSGQIIILQKYLILVHLFKKNNLRELADLEFSDFQLSFNGSLLMFDNTTSTNNNSAKLNITEDYENKCSFTSINVSTVQEASTSYWVLGS